MSMSIGCVGCGNMGGAILAGLAASSLDCTLYGHTRTAARMAPLEAAGVTRLDSARELARKARYVVMAVKPYQIEALLAEMAPEFGPDTVVISVAAGISIARLQAAVAGRCPVVRCMPNTPALVGAGFTALCEENSFSKASLGWAKELFSTLGVVQVLPERLFDAVVAVSGSSPAYVYMFIEAMADGAVRLGMPRKMAIQAAAQAVLGSAKMVLTTGEHPAALKDNVCSPGGTTIEAVQSLEKNGFRSAVLEAMDACARKNRKMSAPADRRGKL